MAKAKAPKPNSPAAPSADGNQPSQVGAGKQPAGSSSLPAGSASADQASRTERESESESGTPQAAAGDESQDAAVADPAGGGSEGLGEITQDLRVHAAAVQADIPTEVLHKACAPRPEISDVIAARQYPDRWVLVVLTEKRAFKVEVPHEV